MTVKTQITFGPGVGRLVDSLASPDPSAPRTVTVLIPDTPYVPETSVRGRAAAAH